MVSGELPTPIPESAHSNSNPRIYSIQNNHHSERSPLLNQTDPTVETSLQIGDRIFLAILILILVCGLLIGAYLLLTEGHEHKVSKVHNLTSRERWKAHVPSATMPKLKLPAQRVLFLQTNSKGCDSKSHCARLVQELQLQHMTQWKEPDIKYNFVVSGDGSIFEGRGWQFQSSLSRNAVTIAFVGTLQGNSLTRKHTASTKLFMDEAISKGKLERCVDFQIWGDNGFFITLLENIQNSFSVCDRVT